MKCCFAPTRHATGDARPDGCAPRLSETRLQRNRSVADWRHSGRVLHSAMSAQLLRDGISAARQCESATIIPRKNIAVTTFSHYPLCDGADLAPWRSPCANVDVVRRRMRLASRSSPVPSQASRRISPRERDNGSTRHRVSDRNPPHDSEAARALAGARRQSLVQLGPFDRRALSRGSTRRSGTRPATARRRC